MYVKKCTEYGIYMFFNQYKWFKIWQNITQETLLKFILFLMKYMRVYLGKTLRVFMHVYKFMSARHFSKKKTASPFT